MSTPAVTGTRRPSAFTCRANGRLRALVSEVHIFPSHRRTDPAPTGKSCQALYDTGATNSSISSAIVASLGLPSIGMTTVGVGGGPLVTSRHMVNIGLPNGVMFSMVQVASIDVGPGIDAIIGMDILGEGDFSVTNHQGKTTFSFCCPSRREVDFVSEVHADQQITPVHSDKISRNSNCPCGSGKKYKKCHGAPGSK